jgi:hypothetical protein
LGCFSWFGFALALVFVFVLGGVKFQMGLATAGSQRQIAVCYKPVVMTARVAMTGLVAESCPY